MSFFSQHNQFESVCEPLIESRATSTFLKLQSSIVGPLVKSLQYPSNFEQIKYAALFKTDDQIIPVQPGVGFVTTPLQRMAGKKGEQNVKPSKPEEGWRQVGDRDIWFHSKIHANYARYLDLMQSTDRLREWHYKPRNFRLKGIRGGYSPSFQVIRNDGTHFWIEVDSTYTDFDLMVKILSFQFEYPDEELLEDDLEWFKESTEILKKHIPSWEDCN